MVIRVFIIWMCLGSAVACANAAVIFQDDFNDGDAAGWSEYDGTFSVVSGTYRIQSTAFANDARSVVGDAAWADYTIDLDFNLASSATPQTCVLFRVEQIASGVDAGRYYQFLIKDYKVAFSLINYSGGNATNLKSVLYPVATDTWHHVELAVEGATATAYLDGVPVLDYDGFTHYPTGRIGLKTINRSTAFFDNIVVTPEPATVSLLALGGLAVLWRRRRGRPLTPGHRRTVTPNQISYQ